MSENYCSAKPILFNTKMVRAVMSGLKTQTRRVANIDTDITCLPGKAHEFVRDDFGDGVYTGYVCKNCGFGVSAPHGRYPVGSSFLRPKYDIGDILYIRETWAMASDLLGGTPGPVFMADYTDYELDELKKKNFRWRPSIHMPKEIARTFLRVTDVKLERLQDIFKAPPGPDNPIVKEGCRYGCDFIAVWENTVPKSQRDVYGYDANPWVWVYEFEILTGKEAC